MRSLIVRSFSLALLAAPVLSQAAFLEDSKTSLELRNFYFNRDFRQPGGSAGQSKQDEWAQGFIMRYSSGFTEGPVGLGIDALGLWGVKLDSGRGERGTGLLPVHNNGDVPDEYGKLGATLKMRLSQTTFRYGTLIPDLPTVSSSDLRLLPQTFRGGQITSNEIAGLTLNTGRLTRNVQRNSSSTEKITLTNKGMTGLTPDDQFDFFSVSYKWLDNLTVSYNYANLEDNYRQNYFTLLHNLDLGTGRFLKTDVRYARSSDDGRTNVDNHAMQGMFTYRVDYQAFGLGLQKMTGDTGFAYLAGTNPYLVNFVQINDFANPNEKSWQARYDYDFAGMGIPGLSFMTRYAKGWDFKRSLTGTDNGTEWERDMDIGYVVQEGVAKNLGLKWRNATFRSNKKGNDLDENRVILSYSIPLL